ncbi:MAG: diguanylate cyclase response regulator [Rhodospirillaceae bacterium]|nr:diguanylate cyclase response regulator [Rhodospirillaceae bacterium]
MTQIATSANSKPGAPIDPAALRVLLFEDSALDAALIKKFLQTAGVRQANILHTDTIPSALQLLTREPVDVCIADYYLRPHTGFDLMDEARRFDIDVPFIMVTAMDDREIDRGALDRGAYGFLVKADLTVEGLERSIRYALVRHARESKLARAAVYDAMTDLPNRAAFMEKLTQAVDDHRPKAGMLSLVLLNMHAMRYLNDAYGQDIGDDVIRVLAERLKGRRRATDVLARVGGDTFALIMSDVVLQHHAVTHARKLVAEISAPAPTRDGEHDICLAGGLASETVRPGGAPTADIVTGLLHRATAALAEAKQATRMKKLSEVVAARLN